MHFHINNISFEKDIKEKTILQVCEEKNIIIPRFCYHEKLSIAGNCRMCLVEVEKSPKPIASCALPISDNMKIFTNTSLVKKAREGILEFLLINHPLDCPICDWGGECDLQDQTMVFGGDRGRFYEEKRSVSDKNCGPFIKTFMTRCIHCTRCVRFYTEIAGISVLGTTGRGSKMEISSYVPEFLDSELSGNLIDLCPVGALTSKPSAFRGRPWEFESFKMIDPFDAFGSNIQIDLSGLKIIRVLPLINELVNEEWINDKVRFFFDGLTIQRIAKPYMRKNSKLMVTSWETITESIFNLLKFRKEDVNLIGVFGPLIDLETLIKFKNLINKFGSSSIFFQKDLYFENLDLRNHFILNFNKIKKISYDSIFFVGLDLKKESAILNFKIRKLCLQNNSAFLGSVGFNSVSNFNVKKLGTNLEIFFNILKGKHWSSNYLLNSKKALILLGFSLFFNPKLQFLSKFLTDVKKKFGALDIQLDFFYVIPHISLSNAIELGTLKTSSNFSNFFGKKNIVYALGINQEDSLVMDLLLKDLKANKGSLIFQGHHGNAIANAADFILPTPTFIEKNGYFFTMQGFLEKTDKILMPYGDSRIDVDIFDFFGSKFGLFDVNKNNIFLNFNYLNFFLFNKYKDKTFFEINVFFSKNQIFDKFEYYKVGSAPFIDNFYMTDSITQASVTLSISASLLNIKKLNFNK